MFIKGRQIKITRKAYEYSHMGFKDGTIIPEEIQVMTVRLTRQTKNGLKVHFYDPSGKYSGYAIYVENTDMFKFEIVD